MKAQTRNTLCAGLGHFGSCLSDLIETTSNITSLQEVDTSKYLLARAHQAPNNLTLDEFETLLKQCGWVFKRQKGSHRVWLSPSNRALPIQSDGGKAKSYQVKQALLMIMENRHG